MVLINETDDWEADLIFIGANSIPLKIDSVGSVTLAVTVRASCTVEIVR
jgi:nucleotide-binding universal stress UspA family protein